MLDAGTTYEDLTTALRSEYDGQLERAAADIDTFLAAAARARPATDLGA